MAFLEDEQRTEAPTPRRLDKAQESGDVPQSVELSNAFQAVASAGALALLGGAIVIRLGATLEAALKVALPQSPGRLGTVTGATLGARGVVLALLEIALPLLLVLALAAALGTLGQRAPFFVLSRVAPSAARFDPAANLGRIFSGESISSLILAVLKLGLVGLAISLVVRAAVPKLNALGHAGLGSGLVSVARLLLSVLWATAGVLVLTGVVDLVLTRRRFAEKLRMTRQEVKEEHREEEGDPAIKGRVRALQRALRVRGRMLEDARRADVIVTNPVHLAVALGYDRETMGAPRVLAKGAERLAEQLRAIAREEGIAVVENKPLARVLFRTVEVGGEVPPKLYQAVAEVLAFVYRLKRRGP